MTALANIEAEAELLGALMCDNYLVDRALDYIGADDFTVPVHGRIFATIAHEVALGKQANSATLRAFFHDDAGLDGLGGVSYLAQLTGSMQGLLDPRSLMVQIADLSARRRMQAGLQDAAHCCADLTTPLADVVSLADDAVSERAQDAIHQPTGADCISELFASYATQDAGVTCGQIPSLDALLGPVKPKQLVIVAGRPGMGKTAAALSYGLGAAKLGQGVLFVSLEMSSTELGARMAADMCFDGTNGVAFNAIRDGTLNDWQRRAMAQAHSELQGYPFQVIDTGGLTVGRLKMLVRRHARRMEAAGFSLGLVIVDYLQLLRTDSRGRSNYEDVSEISRTLKEIAKGNGVGVMALAQLSREVEKRPDKRPQLSDLRDSGQIEQDADAVLFLLRPEYYLRQEEPDQFDANRIEWEGKIAAARGVIEFILAKRRNGETGAAMGQFHGGYQAVRG